MGLLRRLRQADREGTHDHEPELIFITIDRDIFEDPDPDSRVFVHWLQERFACNQETIARSRERLDLVFEGWEDDPRQLWEIPEVVAFVRDIHDRWPDIVWFLSRQGLGLQVLLFCLTATSTYTPDTSRPQDLKVKTNGALRRAAFDTWAGALNDVVAEVGLPPQVALEATESLVHYMAHGPREVA